MSAPVYDGEMSDSPTPLPSVLYHWTEAACVEAIMGEGAEGLRTSVGGFCGQHEDEPAVNLTETGMDPAEGWNENIFFVARPVRLTIDVSQLDPALLGPDLNSLLEDGTAAAMMDDGVDPGEAVNQTWEMSLRYAQNVRYAAPIPASAIIEARGFVAPRDWKASPLDYGYEHEYDEHEQPLVAADWHVRRWPGATQEVGLPELGRLDELGRSDGMQRRLDEPAGAPLDR